MMAAPVLPGVRGGKRRGGVFRTMAAPEWFGVARVVGLVLAPRYASRLGGSMLFQAFAALLVAQGCREAFGNLAAGGMLLVLTAFRAMAEVRRRRRGRVLRMFGLPEGLSVRSQCVAISSSIAPVPAAPLRLIGPLIGGDVIAPAAACVSTVMPPFASTLCTMKVGSVRLRRAGLRWARRRPHSPCRSRRS